MNPVLSSGDADLQAKAIDEETGHSSIVRTLETGQGFESLE